MATRRSNRRKSLQLKTCQTCNGPIKEDKSKCIKCDQPEKSNSGRSTRSSSEEIDVVNSTIAPRRGRSGSKGTEVEEKKTPRATPRGKKAPFVKNKGRLQIMKEENEQLGKERGKEEIKEKENGDNDDSSEDIEVNNSPTMITIMRPEQTIAERNEDENENEGKGKRKGKQLDGNGKDMPLSRRSNRKLNIKKEEDVEEEVEIEKEEIETKKTKVNGEVDVVKDKGDYSKKKDIKKNQMNNGARSNTKTTTITQAKSSTSTCTSTTTTSATATTTSSTTTTTTCKPELKAMEEHVHDNIDEDGDDVDDGDEGNESDDGYYAAVVKKENEDTCFVCKKYGALICCDGFECLVSYHVDCLSDADKPSDMTASVWFCPLCVFKKNMRTTKPKVEAGATTSSSITTTTTTTTSVAPGSNSYINSFRKSRVGVAAASLPKAMPQVSISHPNTTTTTTITTTTPAATTTTTTTTTASSFKAPTTRTERPTSSSTAAARPTSTTTTTTTTSSAGMNANNNNNTNNNNTKKRGVRGPRSALTSFLEEAGISASNIRQRYMQSQYSRAAGNESPTGTAAASAATATGSPSMTIRDQMERRKLNRKKSKGDKGGQKKKRRIGDSDDDEDEEEMIALERPKTRGSANSNKRSALSKKDEMHKHKKSKNEKKKKGKKGEGQGGGDDDGNGDDDDNDDEDDDSYSDTDSDEDDTAILCVSCRRPLPASTLLGSIDPAAPMCSMCSSIISKKLKSKERGTRQKKATDVMDLITTREVQSLQSICAQFIGNNINIVKSFGRVSSNVRDDICSMLCKKRLLNNDTFMFFLEFPTESLCIYDCALVSVDHLMEIGRHLPQLTRLRLDECGKLNDTVLKSISNCCPNIMYFALNGAHLVSDSVFLEFLEGHQIREFEISYNPELSNSSIHNLLENQKLQRLSIKNCSKVTDESFPIDYKLDDEESEDEDCEKATLLKTNLSDLRSLHFEGLEITDNALSLLKYTSSNFQDLCILNCSKLTQRTEDLIGKYVASNLTKFTFDCAVLKDSQLLARLGSKNQKLTKVNFINANVVTDEDFTNLVEGNCGTIEEFTISQAIKLSHESLKSISKCRNLKKVDLSWCYAVDDEIIRLLLENCKFLKQITIFGCHRVTESITIYTKGRVNVIGTMCL